MVGFLDPVDDNIDGTQHDRIYQDYGVKCWTQIKYLRNVYLDLYFSVAIISIILEAYFCLSLFLYLHLFIFYQHALRVFRLKLQRSPYNDCKVELSVWQPTG